MVKLRGGMMRILSTTAVALVLLVTDLSAQVAVYPPVPPYSNLLLRAPVKDPQAVNVVQTAITAMGGVAVIGQIQTWQLQGQYQRTTQSGNETGTLLWEQAGAEFRVQTTGPFGTNLVLTGHGKPAVVTPGGTKTMPAHVIRAMFVPALAASTLLRELQDPNCSIEYGRTTTLGSESVTVIQTAIRATQMEAMVTPQTWFFDSASGLPVRVEFRLPAVVGPRIYAPTTVDFSDYHNVSGALYPFRIVRSEFDKQSFVVTLQSVNVNVSISPGDFDPAVGGAQ
jgi:hypothetical protein